MPAFLKNAKPFFLVALAVIFLLLLCMIPLEGKKGAVEIKKIDMFSDVKPEQNI